jgi:hypothetical protein
MFQPPDGCSAVTGKIRAAGLCDYFEPHPGATHIKSLSPERKTRRVRPGLL